MFNKKRRFDIKRDGKDYIYNFTTSTGIQYDIRFEYVRAGVSHLKCKNLTDTSCKIWNYRDNTNIEFFSTLIAIIHDFNDLIIPDEIIFSCKKTSISQYSIVERIINFFINKYKNRVGFNKLSYNVEVKPHNVFFIIKRNVTNTLLQLKRKRINSKNEI
tara:strand:+ start:236 stop:712 length:477 start_codon:yes stop_codon:yes gene_type:complete